MSETLKVIFSMCMVNLALAALIVKSIDNVRADLRIIHAETIDIRKEVISNRIELIYNRAEIKCLRKYMVGLSTEADS
ncbi:MAG: hypothetical protein OXN26_15565 [Gammaproteobacteria bacterium]|nr:hypothetical protein [Gammaproteobacteria bacterium]